jgi:ribulose-phosphate 3-epimerase
MMSKEVKICPSILSCDFGKLADEVKRLEDAGADAIHVDIMDGHFVPNLTMGPKIVAAIKRNTSLPLDVHLMIYNPFNYIETFVSSGADSITFHFEATEDIQETIDYIKKCNVKSGLAFNPETSLSMIPKYLDKCDMLLLMTVNPGFGGQEFIHDVLEKIRFARDLSDKCQLPLPIQVDGGINQETIRECAIAGATNFVSGSHLFQQKDMKKAIEQLRKAAQLR